MNIHDDLEKEYAHYLRETVARIIGLADIIYFGAYDEMSPEEKRDFAQRLRSAAQEMGETLTKSLTE